MLRFGNAISRLSGGVATNTVAALMVRGVTIATRWAILFTIARFSLPEVFGMVALAMTAAEIIKVVADLGIDYYSIRQFAMMQSKEEEQKLAGTILVIKAIYGLLCYIALAIYFLILEQGQQTFIGLITGLLIITSILISLPISYYQAKLNVIKLIAPVIFTNLIATTGAVLFVCAKINVIYIICILPISEFILAIILLLKLNKDITIKFVLNISHVAFKLMGKALPIGVTSIFIVLYSRIDLVIIKHMSDLTSVGLYGFAFRISEPFQFIAANYSISVYSHVSAQMTKGKEAIKRIARQYMLKALVLGCLSFAACELLATILIDHIYINYAKSLSILNLFALLLIVKSLNSTLTAVIHAYGKFLLITKLSAFNFTFVAIMMVIFVRNYGAIGAAYALLIGEIVNSLLQLAIEKKIVSSLNDNT